MVVNVDVSNAVFWNETSLVNAAREITGATSYPDLAQKALPVRRTPGGPLGESAAMLAMKKLRKNDIYVKHAGRTPKECKFHCSCIDFIDHSYNADAKQVRSFGRSRLLLPKLPAPSDSKSRIESLRRSSRPQPWRRTTRRSTTLPSITPLCLWWRP